MLNLDRNHMKLFGTDEKLLKDPGENLSVQFLSKMWYLSAKTMTRMTDKVEILHRGQSDPAPQKTSKQNCSILYVFGHFQKPNIICIRIHIRSQKHYSLASNIYIINSLFPGFLHDFFLFWLEFLIISGANIPPIESSSPR